ncbi:MAG: hypothetical protein IV086_14655 [Hyphomonadaceae bacterium]|nr:hypothetical protein [Hyphomonadaceae bacterium]
MAEKTDGVGFYGVLGRVAIEGGGAELRFYPFAFSNAPDGTDVFVATFEHVSFQEADIGPFVGEEVEVEVFPDRAEVVPIFDGRTLVLRAEKVVADWVAYDKEDYVRRIDSLDTAFERLNLALSKAVQKNRKSLDLMKELLRRAEVKAAASDELRVRQASAIAVLSRLIQQLESDD